MKSLMVMALSLGLGLAVGCANKKVNDDATGNGMISSQPMDFGPQGSDSGKIQGLSTVHFDYDRAVLDSAAKAQVTENAKWIKAHPDMKIQIEGHCDARGSVEYNLALGDRRAHTVKSMLVGLGVPENHLTTISYGEERPIAQGDSEEAYAKNRRANFVPLKMDGAPTTPQANAH